jgi:hypothetical protein
MSKSRLVPPPRPKISNNSTDIAALKAVIEREENPTYFQELLDKITGTKKCLTAAQRTNVMKAVEFYEIPNLVSLGIVSKETTVETPWCLRHENLPMKPPGRK